MSSARLSISIAPERAALVREFAAAQGVSVSSVFDDLIASVQPSLTRVLALFQAASSASDSVRSNLASAVLSVEQDIVNAAASADSSVAFLLSNFEQALSNSPDSRLVTRGSHQPDISKINGLRTDKKKRSYRAKVVKHV